MWAPMPLKWKLCLIQIFPKSNKILFISITKPWNEYLFLFMYLFSLLFHSFITSLIYSFFFIVHYLFLMENNARLPRLKKQQQYLNFQCRPEDESRHPDGL